MRLARVGFISRDPEPDDGVIEDVACIDRTEEGLVVTDLTGHAIVLDAKLRTVDSLECLVILENGKNATCHP
jgi:predicted RNA-binding protein